MSTTLNQIQILTLKPNDEYQIKLTDNPTTGFTWVYVSENPDTTIETKREILHGTKGLMGASSTLIITFKSSKSDTLKFYHVRKWLNQKLSDLVPDHEFSVIIKE